MAYAQTATSTTIPGMGATSPLGIPGSMGASAPSDTGVPMGATEVDPGGLSPIPSANCLSTGASSTFDSGGLSAAGSAPSYDAIGSAPSTSNCTSSPNVSTTGTASLLATPGTSVGSALNGGTIPLRSTEMEAGGWTRQVTVRELGSTAKTLAGANMPLNFDRLSQPANQSNIRNDIGRRL
jgi:hypothetical protein